MAYQDALFQLGMDLTRSSPAHEEDLSCVARVERADRNGSAEFVTKTIVIDLVGAGQLASVKTAERAVARALDFARANLLKASLKRAPKTGAITGSVLFEGGHVAIEAWPSSGYVAIDVMANGLRPEIVLTAFADAFEAREAIVKKVRLPSDGARYKKPAVNAKSGSATKAA